MREETTDQFDTLGGKYGLEMGDHNEKASFVPTLSVKGVMHQNTVTFDLGKRSFPALSL